MSRPATGTFFSRRQAARTDSSWALPAAPVVALVGDAARSGTTAMATSTPSRKPTARTKTGLDRRRVAVARVRSISTIGCSLKLARAGYGACCGTEIGGDHRGVVAHDGRRAFGDDLALRQHVEAVPRARGHRGGRGRYDGG